MFQRAMHAQQGMEKERVANCKRERKNTQNERILICILNGDETKLI